MADPTPTAYDTVVYPGFAYAQTHPDHLATLARLCGLRPAPVETCRVLEVGCGDAANLIPMAAALPKASFEGFDLAAGAIERGRALATEIGLHNIRLERRDICELPDRVGEFDYIIAHGFYSWVPRAAREKLLALCRASLAPQGVAFISYNTFPGGHIRQMLREMMLFHVERAPDPETKTTQARALLTFLNKLNQGVDEFQALLRAEVERVLKYRPAHLYHDDLGAIFDCFYLYEFIGHATAHGLQYLGDLNSTFVHIPNLDAETTQALAELESDPVLREQYLDFACCRRFRQTLVCREGLPVEHNLAPERLEGLLVSSPAKAVSGQVDLNPGVEEEFRGARNASLKTDHPIMKAAMITLAEMWPQRLSLEDLRGRVAGRLALPLSSVPEEFVTRGLIAAFSMRVLDFHAYSPRVVRHPGEYPQTSLLIRTQAARGEVLTSLLHQSVKVEGDALALLGLLDGRHNRAQLAALLPLSPAEIDAALERLAELALLEV